MKMLTVFCFVILSFCAQAQLEEQNAPMFVDCIIRNESKSVGPMLGYEAGITQYIVEGVNIESGELEQVASYQFLANGDAEVMRAKKNKFKHLIKANCRNAGRLLFLYRKWI